jgi:uncharacterized membrane protein HdeD (DUF308 family)
MHELPVGASMLRAAIRSTWWVFLLQGLASLAIGLLLLFRPGSTLLVLTIMLGAFWLVGGVADAIGAVSRRDVDRHWAWSLTGGVIGAIVGLMVLARPMLGFAAVSMTIVVIVALGAIISGALSAIWAIRVRREIEGEGWIILFGVLSVLFGLALLAAPFFSIYVFVLVAAVMAIGGGIAGIVRAFKLRSIAA